MNFFPQIIKDKYTYWSNHQGFRRYFANTSWLFAEKFVKIFVSFFVSIWIARYLGPSQFGLLNYAQSFVALFSCVATLGLDSIVVRELVKDKKKKDEILGTSLILKLISSISISIIFTVFLHFLQDGSFAKILILILTFSLIFQSFNVIDYYFQSVALSKYVVIINTICLIFSNIVKIILLWKHLPIIYFAWAIVFDSIVLAAGLIYFYGKKHKSIFNWKFKKELAFSFLKDSCPLIIGGILTIIHVRIDQVMIKNILGNTENGYYSVAIRLVEMFTFVSILLNQSLFPALIVEGKLRLDRLYRLYQLQFYSGFLIAFFIIFFAHYLTVGLYGIVYAPVEILLILSVLRVPLTSLAMARGSFIAINNYFKYSTIVLVESAFVNILLNYLMIPKFGSKGAIFATIISSAFVFTHDFFHKGMRKNLKIIIKSILFKGYYHV